MNRLRPVAGLGAAATLGLASFQEGPPAPLAQLVARLQRFYTDAFPATSYLHLNQAAYGAGETLWFKAYVLSAGTHRPDTLSKVLYVDVVTPARQVIFQRTLALRAGLAEGDIVLPDTLSQGVYTIRAYTSWMRNAGQGLFFSRQVPVWQVANPTGAGAAAPAARAARPSAKAREAARRPDVQFFPEGGNYVAGLQTVVGVKAVDATGRGLALQGTIVDEQGGPVGSFSTPALGMSSFPFTPAPERRYFAQVTLPDGTAARYPLPAVQPAGWVLSVREIGAKYHVFVRRQATGAGAALAQPMYLLGHVRGQLAYTGAGKVAVGETFSAVIPKAQLPAGLLHLTLFDEQQVAQAERLVMVPETQPVQVSVLPDKATYGPRQAVDLTVSLRTASGEPLAGELSVSVTAAGLPTTATSSATMQTHLLLTSELAGYVEDPGYYFRNPTPATYKALNDLLLTQGWTRFVWKEQLGSASAIATYDFPLERSLTLSGQLVQPNGAPAANGQLTLLQPRTKKLTLGTANAGGYFLFSGFPGQDTTQVLLQGRREKGRATVLVKLNELWPAPPARYAVPLLPLESSPAPELLAYSQRSRRQQVLERQFRPDTTSGIVLRNVTITGRKSVPSDPRSLHGNTASYSLLTRDYPEASTYPTVFELIQGRAPGVQVLRSGNSYRVLMRGPQSITASTEPLYVLDGVPLADADALMSVPASEVERVDVLQGPAGSAYGIRGGNGAIVVFTKRGFSGDEQTAPALGSAVRQLPAYYRVREFYAPRYATPSPKPDPRVTTLYWQPRLPIPAAGQGRVSFYTADQPGIFTVVVEGVSASGQPVWAESRLVVGNQP